MRYVRIIYIIGLKGIDDLKPVIGIPGYLMRNTRYHELPFHANVTQQNLVDVLTEAGALPIVLPLSDVENVKQYVDQVDGILLAGGSDVDPQNYNEQPQPLIKNVEPDRDEFEIAIIKEARKQNKPIMGICRGMQVLNVAFGGNLYQDLSYYDGLAIRHSQTTPIEFKTHAVKFKEGSFLADIFGLEDSINTLHHQAVKDLGSIFEVTAWAPDGVIEAIESVDDGAKVIGIQWHPEETVATDPQSQELFNRFVELAK